MKLDELYQKLNTFAFVEHFYIVAKKHDDDNEVYRVLNIFSENAKLAEVYLDEPFMMRTSNQGFSELTLIERQALFGVLVNFSQTPMAERQSELYFVYYNDLNNIPHFIKRLANGRLTDDMIPFAYFRTMTSAQRQRYLFNAQELDELPINYRPKFTPDSFVKTKSFEEFEAALELNYPKEVPEERK